MSLLRHADISVTWRLRSKAAAVSVDQVAALATLPRLRGLAIEPARDPTTNYSIELRDEGAALLFQSLHEQIDRGLMLARLEFSYLGIGQAGGAALAAFIERSTLTTLKATFVLNLPLLALASSLAHCRTLTSLEVHAFACSPETIRALATAVQHSDSLTTLKLTQLRLDKAAATTALADAVAHSRSLTDLQLPACLIDNAAMETLIAAIEKRSSSIRTLDVADNQIRSAGASSVARLLSSDRCTLSSLDISGNRIGLKGALALAAALQTNRTLTELRINRSGLLNEGTAAVVSALRLNPHFRLRVLALSGNVSQPAAAALAEALQRSGTLERLEMRDCSLTDDGMTALAAGIGHSHSLQHLDVSDNSFSTAGATALATAVGACPDLASLNMSGNAIGDAGLAALAPALVHVRSLHLHSCSLTPQSGGPLAWLIQHSRVLESLSFGKDNLSARGVTEIAAALQPSSSLRTLRIMSENEVGADGVSSLADALSRGWKASELRLDVCRSIDDCGAVALAKALEQLGSRCTLTTLSLFEVGITATGAMALVRAATRTPRLRTLDLRYNEAITAADRPALIAACGPQAHFELSLSSSSD